MPRGFAYGSRARCAPCTGADMRANVNVAQKKRYTLNLTDFRGVDLSSSPLKVATTRATYMRNLICENGVNHKRPGWREVLGLDGRINGIFPFKEAGADVLLVHAGSRFYRVVASLEGVWSKTDITGSLVLADRRSQCFYRDGRAYIIGCGDYLVYAERGGVYALTSVRDGDCYVPTTTISIDSNDVADTQIAVLEQVNLLTAWRKNTLVGSTAGKESSFACWKLDGRPIYSESVTVSMDWRYTFDTTYTGSLTFTGKPIGSTNSKTAANALSVSGTIYAAGTECTWGDALGYTPKMWVTLDGFVYADFPTTGPVSGAANMTVKFYANGAGRVIEQCTVGALFGADGASDRLFLSGNPDEIGMDRWSEAGDFTYFPDGNAMYVGGNEAAITGYARLSDATLAVFKEQAQGYPTVYYRTAAKETITDADGDTVPATYFPVVAGTVGEGLSTPHAVANLAGDPLILSPNGVFGIELSQNVASGERYAKERSRAIYEELRRKDLTSAAACIYRGRYYLSVGDGICYVADSRYKTSFDGSPDTGYEWWVWDNVPATAFAVLGNELLFGDKDGCLCLFEEGIFSDRTCTVVQSGQLKANTAQGYLVCSEDIQAQAGDGLTVRSACEVLLLDVDSVENGRICFAPELLSHLGEGLTVFTSDAGESGLESNTPYLVTDIDPAGLSFALADEEGNVAEVVGSGFRLVYSVQGQECFLQPGEEAQTLWLADRAGCRLQVVGGDTFLLGEILHYMPVEARWRTPVMDFGTNSARKSLVGITIANEPYVEGRVAVSIETRGMAGELLKHGLLQHGGQHFDLADMNLSDFSFDSGFARSCRRRLNIRNINFALFEFCSDEASDLAVSNVALEYKIDKTNRGIY